MARETGFKFSVIRAPEIDEDLSAARLAVLEQEINRQARLVSLRILARTGMWGDYEGYWNGYWSYKEERDGEDDL